MLMEYATGGDLYSRLKQLGRLEEPLVQPIVRDVCEGLKMIHNMGFIHRDLKPENIIFQFVTIDLCRETLRFAT